MTPSGKPLLLFNGAEFRLQITVCLDGALLAHQEWVAPGRAMQFLAPAVAAMLGQLRLAPADLGGVACVRGPGGFTGLRLVLATALGIALGSGLPMAAMDYLEILADGPAKLLGRPVAVLTHSRRREVYYREFAPGEAEMRALAPVAGYSLGEAARRLGAFAAAGPVAVLGSGLRRNLAVLSAALGEAASGVSILPEFCDNPGPEALIRAASRADWSLTAFEPHYLRGSDAEENLETFAAARGINPEDARRTLAAGAN
ncbi:MAG: tRNA (adenosine(37)-N6)-threonylcarbamoyltransferase complex dimerization subunit type 1 TsaB [Desulfovibrionaceae bacterium]|nr:tRNA (adenosine(37)-N6)-threonylcarbamoyltransferase complex dimerization subunit type 1 TsaB [Desulfovibrionaceae bacterium]